MTVFPRERGWQSTRLQGHDYTQPGAYFVTICTWDRECILGEIVDGEMRPSAEGMIVGKRWKEIPDHFPDVELDAFVVMPNHVHGIVVILETAAAKTDGQSPPAGATHASPLQMGFASSKRQGVVLPACASAMNQVQQRHQATGPQRRSLGAIVGSFKSAVARSVNQMRGTPGAAFWQRNYYEHVVRNEKSLDSIRRYIAGNPSIWAIDAENRGAPPLPPEILRAELAKRGGFTNEDLDFILRHEMGYRTWSSLAEASTSAKRVGTTRRVGATHASPVHDWHASPVHDWHASPVHDWHASPANDSHASPVHVAQIHQADPSYPSALSEYLAQQAPEAISFLGNLDILAGSTLALFCSVRCPGRLILETYDLAQKLRHAGVAVIGGFHSPMEQECLTVLLRGTQPVVVCLARALSSVRLPSKYRRPIDDGRLLLLSPFEEGKRRATVEMALFRNRLVAALADRAFVAYAAPASKTEQLCREVAAWGKPLCTFEDEANSNLMALGAEPVKPENVVEWMRRV